MIKVGIHPIGVYCSYFRNMLLGRQLLFKVFNAWQIIQFHHIYTNKSAYGICIAVITKASFELP